MKTNVTLPEEPPGSLSAQPGPQEAGPLENPPAEKPVHVDFSKKSQAGSPFQKARSLDRRLKLLHIVSVARLRVGGEDGRVRHLNRDAPPPLVLTVQRSGLIHRRVGEALDLPLVDAAEWGLGQVEKGWRVTFRKWD